MDFVFVTRKALQFCAMSCIKKLIAGVDAIQLSLNSAPLSSSSSSTGASRRSTSPFRRRKSEEKKAAGDDQPSLSAPAIDPSDASAVAASYTSTGAMDDTERRLRIVEPEAAGVFGRHMPLSLQTLHGYVVTRRGVLYGGVVCAYDVALSAMLSVSLMGQLPSRAVKVGTKSGSKRIFAAADVNELLSINDQFKLFAADMAIAVVESVVVKLDEEVKRLRVAACEEG
ncbi:uncharacterized protein MONOS_9057 [Monocercomonoides exilis]|uniref:uncharacterized protein n=1 Tax=Monocercomonoides exilis TaxID=2049356 RepID=UPI003559ACA9|nr:hypothetical protein MONOS_9057 [Monocercomonoides exilis]|eukprot:MONOS_9057.1-p1 / transcript=MONOS_9057.1 / gene=MONOS_9057 / organism=Monocercomonoides_exilis_PA203 / gene_product=unspecified product / transcript_product=unspecified product / location=Mono_scaffold00360:54231-54911(-) / protein_length=227 / sequence_SO=supercontig / SO=protein_coding / is_pseudo=false